METTIIYSGYIGDNGKEMETTIEGFEEAAFGCGTLVF